jgi:hypothetical protein
MLSSHRAGRVAEHALSVAQRGWRRPPAATDAVAEQLGGHRLMIPHGDRRDGAQSCGVEHDKVAAIERQDDVMSVLVLRDDLAHLPDGLLLPRPREYLSECVSSGECCRRALNETFGD